MPVPHKLNVLGDFYVEDGCCMCCDVPFNEATQMFKYDDTNHCYVCRQPQTSDDVDAMIRAMFHSETECIFYRGGNPEIFRRLTEYGLVEQCDNKSIRFAKIEKRIALRPVKQKPWWKIW